MDSCADTLAGGLPHSDIHGSTPARGSPWLFAACHVLHRLLVPRHPPNALLILDTPGPGPEGATPHHAQKPSPALATLRATTDDPGTIYSAHQQDPVRLVPDFDCLRNRRPSRSGKIVHNASEPSPPTVGAPLSPNADFQRHGNSRSDIRPNDGSLDQSEDRSLTRTRPETHQNLIHTDKDRHGRQGGRSNGAFARRGRIAPAHHRTELEHSAIQAGCFGRTRRQTDGDHDWWRRPGSNR